MILPSVLIQDSILILARSDVCIANVERNPVFRMQRVPERIRQRIDVICQQNRHRLAGKTRQCVAAWTVGMDQVPRSRRRFHVKRLS
ncbi:hypothetical protein SDC9_211118 [bioreactor metagenome]|uniref:Uncharacterized protein n=1 Tax=bioreactor metagenome TaxID=1076179 RepID=A0A645JJR2_9ZZZZ